ncbi:MAG TPA: histidine--tRNA ligase [Thermoanaerobaculia bacterium]|nr:histidine--tRNA ligase [Thermoanaerobaculia bacterium]
MPAKLRSVKGTRDLLPPETAVWAAVEEVARDVFARYGYAEIRTPILEETELFVRGVGEATDVVGKEMYTFADKKGRSLTLRPESTASVARAFVEHGMQSWPSPVKLFYLGPQFRYERPQAGRYRQFHQIGAELLGDPGPWSDAELLLMLVRFLSELGFSGLTVLLNTLGDEGARAAYREALRAHLEPHAEALSEDSRRRLETNPLRILDSKLPAERELVAGAPPLEACLDAESREHFAAVRRLLDRFGVDYRVEPRLVRGLDYYTRTVFEITAAGLGAQDAIVGGGRYDRLVADLGGPAVPGIGFAIGEDRLIDVLPAAFRERAARRETVHVAAVGGAGPEEALVFAEELRQAGVAAAAELTGRSLGAAMKRADRAGARWAAILGDEEVAAGEVTLRELATGEQRRVARREAVEELGRA